MINLEHRVLHSVLHAEAILYFDRSLLEHRVLHSGLNETMDPRTYGKKGNQSSALTGPGGQTGMTDWRVWNGTGFGQRLQSQLGNMGKGYSAEVTDFGQYIAVRASYHNAVTGKSICKTYVVAFDHPDKGDGRVMVTSQKWRTISSYDQAASYIISSIKSYSGQTSGV